MIYNIQTFCTYGYWPEDLKPQSNKFIITACDNCGDVRITKKQAYRDLCVKCSQQKRGKEQIISDETKEKMSHARLEYLKENPITDETKKKMSDSAVKRCEENPVTDEMKEKNRNAQIERYKNPLAREKTSKANIKRFEDPVEREKLSIAQLKRYSEMDDPGQEIVTHHYIYDFNDLTKYTIMITRSEHTTIHNNLRWAKLEVPCINILKGI